MQDRTITFVLAGAAGEGLAPLTTDQPKVTLPFGGLFRLVDFVLSNILRTQLRRIFILTSHKHERVNEYIGNALKQLSADFRWDCGEELVCLPPSDNLSQIPEIVRKSGAEYALVLAADQIYQMDYRKLFRFHAGSASGVTSPMKGIYLFNRDAILGKTSLELEEYDPGSSSFSGYFRTIENLDDYHAANMDFLSDCPGFDPYSEKKLLQTSRFASNSRVALGARLISCKVSDSIISAGVRIESGAVVENSVILPGGHIEAGAEVRNAIVAENARVPAETQIGVHPAADRRRYVVTPHGITVFAELPGPVQSDRPIRRRCARVATKARFAIAR